MQHRSSLGKGLSALLGEDAIMLTEGKKANENVLLSSDEIRPSKYQPRLNFNDETLNALVDSIREKGILQPLIVRPLPQGGYEIIAGERRWRAAKILNFSHVPVIIREYSDKEALEIALIENIQRENLDPIEESKAYQRLVDEFGHTQEALAKAIGKSRSYVANILRLNTLPEHVKTLIQSGRLSAGHARALINHDNIEPIVEQILKQNLSVRDVEKLVKTKKPSMRVEPESMQQTKALEEQLERILSLKVSIKLRQNSGSLTVFFDTFEKLDTLLDQLRGDVSS